MLGVMDQWEWELRVVDLQDGDEGDEIPYAWVAEERHIAAVQEDIG